MEIKNKTAVITGGASGLGEAALRQLVQAGSKAVILDLNEERGQALEAELGSSVVYKKTDVSIPGQVTEAIQFVLDRFSGIDILVNCAAIAPAQKITDVKRGPHDLDLFRKTVDINLIGSFDIIRNAATAMLNNQPNADGERGVIINTASVAAFDGQIGQVAYTATKAAIAGMTLPLARDLSSAGIRVMTIAPGIFLTPMLQGLPENVQVSLGKSIPFPNRLGKPGEYAMLVQQIVENPMLNGETIRLDGAIRMQPK